jgi:hypothetical protein
MKFMYGKDKKYMRKYKLPAILRSYTGPPIRGAQRTLRAEK